MMLGKLSDDSPLRQLHEDTVKSRIMSRIGEMVEGKSPDEIRSLLQDTKESLVQIEVLMDAMLALPDERLSQPECIYNAIMAEIKDGNHLKSLFR